VPVWALLYNAFTEDTGFGPGAFSLTNFVEAYSSWQILALFRNSLVFAVGTAVTTFVLGGAVAWAVERTDAPGAALFHSLALLSFAIPGLLMAMAWIFVFSPNIGWANALMKDAFGLTQAPLNVYSMAGMVWALSSHYFPLSYLSLGPALRVLDVRMEEAGHVSGGRTWKVLTKITLPLLRPAIMSAMLILFVLGMSSYEVPRLIGRPARIDVFTTDAPFTLDNYKFVLSYPIFLAAVKTSVLLAALAATIVSALTLVMAWVALRTVPRFGWLIDALAFIPIAIPGVIVGAGILVAYLMLPIPVYNTIWILLIAYVTLYLPYGMRFSSSGISQIHRELEEVAEVAGARLGQVFARVLLPLLAPVLLAGWIYVFVLSVRELGASIFLVGPGTHVLGTITLTMWEEGGSYGAVAALGVIQVIPLIIIVAGLRWLELNVQRRAEAAAKDANSE